MVTEQRSLPAVFLREMAQHEFDIYAARLERGYAESLAESLPADAAALKARHDMETALPGGLGTDGQLLMVAEADRQVVGWTWLALREPQTRTPEVAWLYDIRVHDDHRRRGYGAAILAAVELLARAAGADRLGLNVFGGNREAIALYERVGYQVTAQQMAKPLR